MNLLLFQDSKGLVYPVVEPAVHEPDAAAASDRFLERIKAKAQHAYNQFREKFDYQERVCSYLRHAEHLALYHPGSLSPEAAQKKFQEYLRIRYSKHARWVRIDAVLALLGTLLTPIPGPNVFFLYPAVRTMGHYLARKGARHALELKQISYTREDLIDEVQAELENLDKVSAAIEELERRYQIENLAEHLRPLSKDLKKDEGRY